MSPPGIPRKKRPRLVASALMVLVGALAPARALADEDDGVEAHCTLEEQCLGGVECKNEGFDRAAFDACEAAQRELRNELRCGRGSRSLWCAPGTHGTWKPRHTFLGISCAASPGEPAGTPVVLIAALALAITRRRRRETRTMQLK